MMENEGETSMVAQTSTHLVPVLPLRDVVVYPHMVIPLFVGREKSIHALEAAMAGEKKILLVAQRSAAVDDPQPDDIYEIGTVSSILQLLKLPDGTIKVLVEGTDRARILKLEETNQYYSAQIAPVIAEEREAEVLMRAILGQFDQYVKLNNKVPPEILSSLAGIDDPGRLADAIAAHLLLKIEEKQGILEIESVRARLEKLMTVLESEIDLLQVEKRIRGRVKRQMEKSQREYYLNEQMKAIQKELGEMEDVPNEVEDLARRIEKALEEDHYGLERGKERILEYLAAQSRVEKLKGPILCLVGPPGVGKTSLGRSLARATNRKFIRMALGDVRDEAELRGHRRTYIGALPGKIIQNLAKVGTRNPLFLLDEVDKMSMDFRGDPASALLEVLDPEQNN